VGSGLAEDQAVSAEAATIEGAGLGEGEGDRAGLGEDDRAGGLVAGLVQGQGVAAAVGQGEAAADAEGGGLQSGVGAQAGGDGEEELFGRAVLGGALDGADALGEPDVDVE